MRLQLAQHRQADTSMNENTIKNKMMPTRRSLMEKSSSSSVVAIAVFTAPAIARATAVIVTIAMTQTPFENHSVSLIAYCVLVGAFGQHAFIHDDAHR